MRENKKILLPSGFHDVLPPDAGLEARIISRLLSHFYKFGYEQVKPPLIEFEESLIKNNKDKISNQTFRLLDPVSSKTLAIRADMTPQIARIVSSRLAEEPLPIRICYSGQVVRVRGEGLYQERQLAQAGLELVGNESPLADSEVVGVALSSLSKIKVKDLSVDFNIPSLAESIMDYYETPAKVRGEILENIAKRDVVAIEEINKPEAKIISEIIACTGFYEEAIPALLKVKMPKAAKEKCENLAEVIKNVVKNNPEVSITIDVLEHKGFEYYSGLSFSIFSVASAVEIGRGGRYLIEDNLEATGFGIYVNALARALPKFKAKTKILVPATTEFKKLEALHEKGFITVFASANGSEKEAKKQNCNYYLQKGKLVSV